MAAAVFVDWETPNSEAGGPAVEPARTMQSSSPRRSNGGASRTAARVDPAVSTEDGGEDNGRTVGRRGAGAGAGRHTIASAAKSVGGSRRYDMPAARNSAAYRGNAGTSNFRTTSTAVGGGHNNGIGARATARPSIESRIEDRIKQERLNGGGSGGGGGGVGGAAGVGGRLDQLCPADKRRIGRLIAELSTVTTERNTARAEREQDAKQFKLEQQKQADALVVALEANKRLKKQLEASEAALLQIKLAHAHADSLHRFAASTMQGAELDEDPHQGTMGAGRDGGGSATPTAAGGSSGDDGSGSGSGIETNLADGNPIANAAAALAATTTSTRSSPQFLSAASSPSRRSRNSNVSRSSVLPLTAPEEEEEDDNDGEYAGNHETQPYQHQKDDEKVVLEVSVNGIKYVSEATRAVRGGASRQHADSDRGRSTTQTTGLGGSSGSDASTIVDGPASAAAVAEGVRHPGSLRSSSSSSAAAAAGTVDVGSQCVAGATPTAGSDSTHHAAAQKGRRGGTTILSPSASSRSHNPAVASSGQRRRGDGQYGDDDGGAYADGNGAESEEGSVWQAELYPSPERVAAAAAYAAAAAAVGSPPARWTSPHRHYSHPYQPPQPHPRSSHYSGSSGSGAYPFSLQRTDNDRNAVQPAYEQERVMLDEIFQAEPRVAGLSATIATSMYGGGGGVGHPAGAAGAASSGGGGGGGGGRGGSNGGGRPHGAVGSYAGGAAYTALSRHPPTQQPTAGVIPAAMAAVAGAASLPYQHLPPVGQWAGHHHLGATGGGGGGSQPPPPPPPPGSVGSSADPSSLLQGYGRHGGRGLGIGGPMGPGSDISLQEALDVSLDINNLLEM